MSLQSYLRSWSQEPVKLGRILKEMLTKREGVGGEIHRMECEANKRVDIRNLFRGDADDEEERSQGQDVERHAYGYHELNGRNKIIVIIITVIIIIVITIMTLQITNCFPI